MSVTSLCNECKYAEVHMQESGSNVSVTQCRWQGAQSGTYGNVYKESDCDKFGRPAIQFDAGRYPRRKKGAFDTHVEQISPKIRITPDNVGDIDMPKRPRKSQKKRWK